MGCIVHGNRGYAITVAAYWLKRVVLYLSRSIDELSVIETQDAVKGSTIIVIDSRYEDAGGIRVDIDSLVRRVGDGNGQRVPDAVGEIIGGDCSNAVSAATRGFHMVPLYLSCAVGELGVIEVQSTVKRSPIIVIHGRNEDACRIGVDIDSLVRRVGDGNGQRVPDAVSEVIGGYGGDSVRVPTRGIDHIPLDLSYAIGELGVVEAQRTVKCSSIIVVDCRH